MTPAIELAQRKKIPHQIHEYKHDSHNTAYGQEAAEKLGIHAERVFKTLVVKLDKQQLAVGIAPVCSLLNMKKIAKAAGAKKAIMAAPDEVERVTGYVLGGVSPLGQKKALPTFIDSSAQNYRRIFISAGRRGLEIEIAPSDLRELTQATFSPISDKTKP